MLKGEAATNRALDYVLETFRAATAATIRQEIRLEDLVMPSLNAILAGLTMELGNEDPDRVQLVRICYHA